ncbi:THO complex subunit 7 homolog [Tribolium castaneum]|uniref:THO complex protein 7-like Protein n=1 Tax=Tribolium castaneum TaxID=7070 RepID=D6WD47_TRICA|nr:PREDICTED: THO complex subunit 7 homolog [Tribolium castaneum]EEZ98316.2 THO complex protein 7-like Protein [Tribolium castaneum]|eukprot:XP_971841.2 PREDICTED: THO complex subunit 7 homolog [Tribolium castaneum]
MKQKDKRGTMSDEDIIKRKLLIDGDGTGDDRRLNVIAKTLRKWANSTEDSPLENQATHDKLLAQLSLCEYSVRRSQLLTRTTSRQLENYKKIYDKFEQQISEVKDSIKQNKDNLVQAKIWKQNHMMYDLLAQSIAEQPARKETNERLSNLQAELKELHKEKELLEQKLDMRRKQFHVLVSSASKLQAMLEESNEYCHNDSLLEDVADSTGPEPMSE